MNWGWRIALFYSAFVIFMLGMVYMAVNESFDLTSDDYYEQEVAYQDRIDQLTNAANSNAQVKTEIIGTSYVFSFPEAAKNVKLHFFRPSDARQDHIVEEAVVDSLLSVPSAKLAKGRYQVKIEWESDGISYFQEDNLFVK